MGLERDKAEREETDMLEQEKAKEKARLDIYHKKMRLELLKHK